MSGNDISQRYLELTIPEIERVTRIKPTLWEATIPETLFDGPLRFEPTRPTFGTPYSRQLTETEKSVWYSHFLLWTHIIRNCEKAWIFEHDVDLSQIDLLQEYKKDIVTIANIGRVDCYFLTNYGAKQLYKYALNMPIRFQVDGFVHYIIDAHESLKKIHYTPKLNVKQLTNFGTTIDHQPSSATYFDQE